MQANIDPHTALEAATTLGVAFIAYIVLLIKNSQADTKAQLVAEITKVATSVAVHDAADIVKFEGFSRTISRIDAKLDRLGMG